MLLGKYINKYYLKYIIYLIIGVVSLVIVDYWGLLIPEYLGQIIDLFSEESIPEYSMISGFIGQIILIAIMSFFLRIVWRYTIFHASTKIESSLRHEMFLKSERLSQKYYHENKVGTIMAWFSTDLETIEEYLGWGTIMIVDAVFLSILSMYKMIKMDIFLSIITILPMIIVVILGAWVEKEMGERWEDRQKKYDHLYDFSQENFSGIRVIKAFVKEIQEMKAFKKIAKDNQDANLKFVKVSILFDVLITSIIAIVMALLVGFGGYFVYRYAINNPVILFSNPVILKPGNLVTFIGYFEELVWPMIALGQLVSMYSRSTTSLKRVTDFLDQKEDVKDKDDALILDQVEGKITFKNYNFTYPSASTPSLKNINFEILPGESIGVVGKIGAGKTTLVNALLRLYNVEDKTLFIDDHDIMDISIQNLRSHIAYVPQDNFLFSDSVKNNIAFYNQNLDDESIENAARFADVHDNIINFSDGYNTITGERGVSLSGGQKQRISIARAYIKDAPIMILDDSVSAVDVKTEETILKNIKEQRRGKTTIVIASRVSTVSSLDKILVLKDGCVEAFDTHENLLNISPTYAKMVYLQALEREVNSNG